MEGTRNGKKGTGRVDEYEPNRKVTFEATSGLEKGTTVSYTFEPIEGGRKTRLREVVQFRPNGFMRLLTPFVVGRITRQLRASAEGGFSNLKRILETQAQVAPA